jgi:LemA protein
MAKPSFAQPVNDDSGDQFHRIRRSETLLTELYGRKPKPQVRVRKVRGVRAMLLISLVTVAAALSVVYYKINYFIMLQEQARSKDANLEAAIQRRTNLFDNLVNLTLNHAALEHAIYSHAAEMRTEIIKQSKLPDAVANALNQEAARMAANAHPGDQPHPDWDQLLKSLGSAGGGADSSIGRLLGMVEQYPNIKSSETLQHTITALIEMEDRIAERRFELNEMLRLYNTAVTSFPWQYLASATGFLPKGYSHASDGAAAAKEITPQLYQQLLPLVRTFGESK